MNAPSCLESTEPPVESVLPHRAPMLLVELVLDRGEGFVVCRCRAGRDTPLAEGESVSSLLALEMGAQASALLGPLATTPGAPRPGYLVSIRRATLHQATLSLARPYRVEARLRGRAGGLQVVHVRIAAEDEPTKTLAEADLGTYVDAEPPIEG